MLEIATEAELNEVEQPLTINYGLPPKSSKWECSLTGRKFAIKNSRVWVNTNGNWSISAARDLRELREFYVTLRAINE